jgi:hypothetical protein
MPEYSAPGINLKETSFRSKANGLHGWKKLPNALSPRIQNRKLTQGPITTCQAGSSGPA